MFPIIYYFSDMKTVALWCAIAISTSVVAEQQQASSSAHECDDQPLVQPDGCVQCHGAILGCHASPASSYTRDHFGQFKVEGCLVRVPEFSEWTCLPKFARDFRVSNPGKVYESSVNMCNTIVPASRGHVQFPSIGSFMLHPDGSVRRYKRMCSRRNQISLPDTTPKTRRVRPSRGSDGVDASDITTEDLPTVPTAPTVEAPTVESPGVPNNTVESPGLPNNDTVESPGLPNNDTVESPVEDVNATSANVTDPKGMATGRKILQAEYDDYYDEEEDEEQVESTDECIACQEKCDGDLSSSSSDDVGVDDVTGLRTDGTRGTKAGDDEGGARTGLGVGMRNGAGGAAGMRNRAGAGTKAGDGMRSGAGSKVGTEDGVGTDDGMRSGAKVGTGMRNRSNTKAGMGTDDALGTGTKVGAEDAVGADDGMRSGAKVGTGMRNGSGTDDGMRSGAGTKVGMRNRSGTDDDALGTRHGARTGAEDGMRAGTNLGADGVMRNRAGSRNRTGIKAGTEDGANTKAGVGSEDGLRSGTDNATIGDDAKIQADDSTVSTDDAGGLTNSTAGTDDALGMRTRNGGRGAKVGDGSRGMRRGSDVRPASENVYDRRRSGEQPKRWMSRDPSGNMRYGRGKSGGGGSTEDGSTYFVNADGTSGYRNAKGETVSTRPRDYDEEISSASDRTGEITDEEEMSEEDYYEPLVPFMMKSPWA